MQKTKPKCFVGLVGLARTYEAASASVIRHFLEHNADAYDFVISANTDPSNAPTAKWGVAAAEEMLDAETFERRFRTLYKGYDVRHVTFSAINSGGGTERMRQRCIALLRTINPTEFEACVFLRLDAVANRPVDLRKYLSPTPCLVFMTGGGFNPSRPDHWLDWDYGWAGDYFTMKRWLTEDAPREPTRNDLILAFHALNGCFTGTYRMSVLQRQVTPKFWVHRIWRIFYNLALDGARISFAPEKDGVQLEILREEKN